MHNQSRAMLRRTKVQELTGLSRSTIYKMQAEGKFPKGIQLDDNGRIVAWVSDEIYQWMDDKINAAKEVK